MPTPRTTRPPAPGRFGRPAPPAGRFGRPASGRARARTTLSAGRVPRSSRRPAPRSKSNRALSGLAGLLPGSVLGRAAKPSPRGGGKGRAGKLALVAGAAGLALKNRDKLPGPFGRKDTAEPLPPEPAATAPEPLATPAAVPERQPVQPEA